MRKGFTYHLQAAFLSVIFLSCFIPSLAQQTQEPVYLNQGEVPNTNGYYESLPVDYNNNPDKKYPLLIFLHGLYEEGDGSPTQLPYVLRNGPPKLLNNGTFPSSFTVNGKTFSFIVISPQLIDWPSGNNVSTINDLIDYLLSKYRVDPSRIYLTGLSMGGGITWSYSGYSDEYAQRPAAIIPIAGAAYPSTAYAAIMARNNLPVWAFHNNDDPQVPSWYTIDFVNEINSYKPPPDPLAKMTIFDASGHGGWETAYDPNYTEDGLNVYQWMLQYTRSNTVLPVQLANFTAGLKGNDAVLNWSTATELNNDHFEVERSLNGQSFQTIGSIPGAGTSNVFHAYHYTDNVKDFNTSTIYYRLKQVDLDGHYAFSKVISLRIKDNNKFKVTISPNPFRSSFEIHLQFPQNGKVFIRLINDNGAIVYERTTSVNEGDDNMSINGSSLAAGVYILEIRENDQLIREKIIKN